MGPFLRPSRLKAASALAVRTPVCVLGAGPHGLAAVLHLKRADPELAAKTVVVDQSGRWMATWDSQFARLGIDVLRSPSVHHPSPDVGALSSFVTQHGFARSGLPYDPPVAKAFSAFVQHLIKQAKLPNPLAVRPNRVTAEADGTGVRIETFGPQIVADRLVVAANPRHKLIPSWAQHLQGSAENAGQNQAQANRQGEIAHSDDVNLGALSDLAGQRIVVVGGGLTAVHLATGAAGRGATVDLIARRELQVRSFDTDPGWLGPKYLSEFEACTNPQQRFELAKQARGGGTIPQWMHEQLSQSRVTVHEATQVLEATSVPDGYCLGLTSGESIRANRVWLATGTTPHLGSLQCCEPLLPNITTIGGLPVTDDHLRVGACPVHVMGRLATHTLGPAAGNLWGARHAARRIAQAIAGIAVE